MSSGFYSKKRVCLQNLILTCRARCATIFLMESIVMNQPCNGVLDMATRFFTVIQISEMLKVSRTTIYNWIGEDRFPNLIQLGRERGIPPSDVAGVRDWRVSELHSQIEELLREIERLKALELE